MIKTYISPLIRKMRGGAGAAGTQKEVCQDIGSLVILQAIILPLKKKGGEKEKKTAARKMINVSRTARPSSILLSSLFGRH